MSDDIKKAAEVIIETHNNNVRRGVKDWYCGERSNAAKVARAYLALREQVDTVALPALECTSTYLAQTKASAGDIAPLHEDMQSMVDAAIKAIEELA